MLRRVLRRNRSLASLRPPLHGRLPLHGENLEPRIALASATLTGDELTFQADANESNNLAVDVVQAEGIDFLRLSERNRTGDITAGLGVVADSKHVVRVPLDSVATLNIDLADRSDSLELDLARGPTMINIDAGIAEEDEVIIRDTVGDDVFSLVNNTVLSAAATTMLAGADHLLIDISRSGQDRVAIRRGFIGAGVVDVSGGGEGNDQLTTLAPGVAPQIVTIDGAAVRIQEEITAGNGLEIRENAVHGTDGLTGGFATTVSPDGTNVYVASIFDDAVASYYRDASTGELTFLQLLRDGVGLDGLNGVAHLAISPDGRHVYAGSISDDAVVVFTRNERFGNGNLSFVQSVMKLEDNLPELDSVRSLSVSPDGRNVYAATFVGDAVVVFNRNVHTGKLTHAQTLQDGVRSVEGLDGAQSVSVSADGRHVYAAGWNDDAVVVFRREHATGQLTFVQQLENGVGGILGLDGPQDVQISPDDAYVYVAASFEVGGSVAVFARDAATGELTIVEALMDNVNGVDGLDGARSVAVSADGHSVFVVGLFEDALAAFQRDPESGRLTFVEVRKRSVDGGMGLNNPYDVSLSPEGRHVYVAAHHTDAVTLFAAPPVLEVGYGDIDHVVTTTGDGDDIFHVIPSRSTTISIDGGANTGDAIEFDSQGAATNDTGDNFTSADFEAVTYTDVESVELLTPLTFTVTTMDDQDDGEGTTAHCSLREAIIAANQHPGTDLIQFDIAGPGPYRIRPDSALPMITDSVIIDGTTQPGYNGTPIVEIEGAIAEHAHGLHITAGASTIRALAIGGFDEPIVDASGILEYAGIFIESGGANVLEATYLGVAITGDSARPNSRGVWIAHSANNQIGGLAADKRNVVSGNEIGLLIRGNRSLGNQMQGNYIGADASGAAALGNTASGVTFWDAGQGNLLGGVDPAARNIISGNDGRGVVINRTFGTRIHGNAIGVGASGETLGNGGDGVVILNARNTLLGGKFPENANVVAHNGGDGVQVAVSGIVVLPPPRIGEAAAVAEATTETTFGLESVQNSILGNSIFSNVGLGVDLHAGGVTPNDMGDVDDGPNMQQNFPVIQRATRNQHAATVEGSLESAPNATFRIEVFANRAADESGNGEGELFLGAFSLTTDENGVAAFTQHLPSAELTDQFQYVAATATDASGNTSEFSGAAILGADNVIQITHNNENEDWETRRATVASAGKVLWSEDKDVYYWDGEQIQFIQTDDNNAVDSVIVLGSASQPDQVMGAWRRGTDFAWVWTEGEPPVPIDTSNPFDPNNADSFSNPEGAAIADGHLLMVLQAFDPNTNTMARHVYEIDPNNGERTSLTGDEAVFGFVGGEHLTTSQGQGAWTFYMDQNGAEDPELHFYDGQTTHVIDTGKISRPFLQNGVVVYEKLDGAGVSQIFVYDSTAANPAPTQRTSDGDGGNFHPVTDGTYIAWLHGNADQTDMHVIVDGTLVTDNTSRPADRPPGDQFPLQIDRGQLAWIDQNGALRQIENLRQVAIGTADVREHNVLPANTVATPWLADGNIAWLGKSADGGDDLEVFLLEGAPPPDQTVVANAGGPYQVEEGGGILLAGSGEPATGAVISSFQWDLDGDGVFGESGAQAGRGDESGPSPTFSAAQLDGSSTATFAVALIVEDSAGNQSEPATAEIAILNASPGDTTIGGVAFGVSGQPLAFAFSASDVSPADQSAGFAYEVDWGDGAPLELVQPSGAGQDETARHFFAPPPFVQVKANPFVTVDYDVKVTPIDKDGSRGPTATTTVNIAHIRMVEDDLHIGGTSDRDGLYVWNEGEGQDPGGNDATIQITSTSFPAGDRIRMVQPNPSGKFVLWAGPGNDIIGQFTNFTTDAQDGGKIPDFDNPRTHLRHPTVQHGGPGSDLLTGGTANDVLYGDEPADGVQPNDPGRIDRIFGLDGDDRISGGMGDDRIRGHSGNDYLAGEDGSDRILGDNGLDIMDGGDGRDAINGLRNNDIVIGGPGDDFISDIRGGFSLFIGGTGFDRLDSSRTGGNAIFIPGTTTYDRIDQDNPFDSALVELLNEWSTVNSGNINQIVNNLTTGDGGRLQPLNSGSVFDDSSTDWLIGDLNANNPLGPDLFFEVNQPDDVVNPDASLNELGPLPNDVVVNP